MEKGLNIISLPKSINNEVDKTDQAIGYNTALEVAAQSIDRLHSTALSNHRILIVEMMGRRAGWLALGAGIAGGADIIIIPEIPYDIQKVAQAIFRRDKAGKRFSLVSVSERIISLEEVAFGERLRQMSVHNRSTAEQDRIAAELTRIENRRRDSTIHLSNRLKELTGLETRMTILGYLLRGGAPSAGDRILATQLGEAAVAAIQRGQFGVMVALRDGRVEPVPLDQVCGQYKTVPQDHPLIESARRLGISLGD
jgi:6-phosphofructokinase 1